MFSHLPVWRNTAFKPGRVHTIFEVSATDHSEVSELKKLFMFYWGFWEKVSGMHLPNTELNKQDFSVFHVYTIQAL